MVSSARTLLLKAIRFLAQQPGFYLLVESKSWAIVRTVHLIALSAPLRLPRIGTLALSKFCQCVSLAHSSVVELLACSLRQKAKSKQCILRPCFTERSKLWSLLFVILIALSS